MGCAGVPRCRHPVHHVWVPPGGQQGVWQGLQRPGGHLPQAGARLRPRPLPAPITHVSPPPPYYPAFKQACCTALALFPLYPTHCVSPATKLVLPHILLLLAPHILLF